MNYLSLFRNMRAAGLFSLFCFLPAIVMAATDCTERFSWLPNTESDLAGYRIFYGLVSGGPYSNTVDIGKPAPVDGRIFGEITGLECGKQYYFVCTAYNGSGDESAYSAQVAVQTVAPDVPPVDPDPSQVFTAVLGDSSDANYAGTIQDTFININEENRASSQQLNTYTWPVNKIANSIIMKINLNVLPINAIIQDATLQLYLINSGGDISYDISIHKIINKSPNLTVANGFRYDGVNGWTPNTKCYNNIPMAQADIASAEDIEQLGTSNGYKSWTVTNMIKDWVANPSGNYGLLLNSDPVASAGSYRTFASSEATDPNVRPKLIINYVLPSSGDTTPPADVTNFTATPGTGQVALAWRNPSDSDFAGVMLRYRTDGTYPASDADGTAVPNGNNGKITGQPGAAGSYTHTGLNTSLTYYYSAFTYDAAGNYSQTAHASAKPIAPNSAPVISSFTGTPSTLNNPGGQVSLAVQASDPDGDSVSCSIAFGDGSSPASSCTAVHVFSERGTYTSTATVNDGKGNTASRTLQIQVNDIAPATPSGVTVH